MSPTFPSLKKLAAFFALTSLASGTPSRHVSRQQSATPLRLMPLGDSVTWGYQSTDGNGYRSTLFNLLAQEGHSLEFVGSNPNGDMSQPDNEGWPGYEINAIGAKAHGTVPGYKPNIYTVMMGVNDCGNNDDIANAANRISAVFDDLWSMTPDATIIMATITPNGWGSPWEDYVQQVNQDLHDLFNGLYAAGKRIEFVDFHDGDTALTHPNDFADNLHPNDEGYAKMGNLWFLGIQRAEADGFLVPPQ